MLLIPCPWCGPRDESEFKYGGEAHIQRPLQPDALDDAAWGDYVFMRDNPAGVFRERWVHSAGCRRWFNVARDTLTNAILASYKMSEEALHQADPDPGRGRRPDDEPAHGGEGEAG